MAYYADPAGQKLQASLRNLGFRNDIFSSVQTKAVINWRKECAERRMKEAVLIPECMKIANEEVTKLEWTDECFESFVFKMFSGADISQLESFYTRYRSSRNRTAFFLRFVKYEL